MGSKREDEQDDQHQKRTPGEQHDPRHARDAHRVRRDLVDHDRFALRAVRDVARPRFGAKHEPVVHRGAGRGRGCKGGTAGAPADVRAPAGEQERSRVRRFGHEPARGEVRGRDHPRRHVGRFTERPRTPGSAYPTSSTTVLPGAPSGTARLETASHRPPHRPAPARRSHRSRWRSRVLPPPAATPQWPGSASAPAGTARGSRSTRPRSRPLRSARLTSTTAAGSDAADRTSSTSGYSADAVSVSAGSASRSGAASGGSSRHPDADVVTVRPLTEFTHTRTFISVRATSAGQNSPTGTESGPSACAGSGSAKLSSSTASFASTRGANVQVPAAGASSGCFALSPCRLRRSVEPHRLGEPVRRAAV